ncbi:MAG: hypothetical protein HY716_16225 [Planctomycetes bacterium]|nr:hypothetical protein [Planctomycetota bacterium]
MGTFQKLCCAGVLVALLAPVANADILLFKNGGIKEVKIIKAYMKKPARGGGPKEHILCRDEDGKEHEYMVKDIGQIIKKKPSWEERAEDKEWYEKEVKRVPEREWQKQISFARRIRLRNRCKYLEEEAYHHFRIGYELRKPELKDDPEVHGNIAKMLERDYRLIDEAREEWRWVFNHKKEGFIAQSGGIQPPDHVTLAKWATREGLYDEALAEYNAALTLDPNYMAAKIGLERLKKALEVPVNPQLFKLVKERIETAIKFLLPQQHPDGSFGSDVANAGVKGFHGMTCLAGLALVSWWEFQILEDFDRAQSPPAALLKLVQFVLQNKDESPKLSGPDVWGPVFRLPLLARLYKKEAFKGLQREIKERALETVKDLQEKVRSDGGWSYYDFTPSGSTFVTAAAVHGFMDLVELGIEVDQNMIVKGCEMMKGNMNGEGRYCYHSGVRGEPVEGCAGRSSQAESAILRAGQGGQALPISVDNFMKYRHLLEAIKGQPGTHIGTGMTAPYYYLFSHYWTTRATKLLPKNMQMSVRKSIGEIIVRDQEGDGAFSDSPLIKDWKICGTALGVMIMYEVARDAKHE